MDFPGAVEMENMGHSPDGVNGRGHSLRRAYRGSASCFGKKAGRTIAVRPVVFLPLSLALTWYDGRVRKVFGYSRI